MTARRPCPYLGCSLCCSASHDLHSDQTHRDRPALCLPLSLSSRPPPDPRRRLPKVSSSPLSSAPGRRPPAPPPADFFSPSSGTYGNGTHPPPLPCVAPPSAPIHLVVGVLHFSSADSSPWSRRVPFLPASSAASRLAARCCSLSPCAPPPLGLVSNPTCQMLWSVGQQTKGLKKNWTK